MTTQVGSRPERVVAIDLGGTFTKIALADQSGAISAEDRLPTELGPRGDRTTQWLAQQISTLAAAHPEVTIEGYGVACPGIIDAEAQTVRVASNIGWRDEPLQRRLTELTGLPGRISHDVRSGGLAEWRLGGAVGAQNLIFLPLGTGIAAALVVDGRLLEADGYAGELGHGRVVAADSLACPCGKIGCLETISSATGVARNYARLTGFEVDTRVVAERARAHDPAAVEAFTIAIDGLVEALDLTITLLGPEVIIIGGGLAGAADLLLPELDRRLAQGISIQRRPKLIEAALGSRAGVIGAGLLGWSAVNGAAQR